MSEALEREALALLRLHPRSLQQFADMFGSPVLCDVVADIRQRLLDKRLIAEIGVLDFVVLTTEGLHVQKQAPAPGDTSAR